MKITKYSIIAAHPDDEMLGARGKMFNLSFLNYSIQEI